MVRITRVTKTFGDVLALSDVSVEIAAGECLGFTGSNGAGRTTLLQIVATLMAPTSGTVEIDGLDAVKHVYQLRRRIAYVGDHSSLSDGMRAADYLRLVARARHDGGGRVESLSVDRTLVRAGVDGAAAVSRLSAGHRQRLALAAALSSNARVLVLDDPFRALDANGRALFAEWLHEVREQGAAAAVSANVEADLRLICQRMARLDEGRLVDVTSLPSAASADRSRQWAGAPT